MMLSFLSRVVEFSANKSNFRAMTFPNRGGSVGCMYIVYPIILYDIP